MHLEAAMEEDSYDEDDQYAEEKERVKQGKGLEAIAKLMQKGANPTVSNAQSEQRMPIPPSRA